MVHSSRPEGSLKEFAPSLHRVDPGHWTLTLRLGGKPPTHGTRFYLFF